MARAHLSRNGCASLSPPSIALSHNRQRQLISTARLPFAHVATRWTASRLGLWRRRLLWLAAFGIGSPIRNGEHWAGGEGEGGEHTLGRGETRGEDSLIYGDFSKWRDAPHFVHGEMDRRASLSEDQPSRQRELQRGQSQASPREVPFVAQVN
jgi:hypothetical protein